MLRFFGANLADSDKNEGKDPALLLLDMLEKKDLRCLVQTTKFFQKKVEPHLLKEIPYVEKRIKIAISEIEKLAKEIQQRTPFLVDVKIYSFDRDNISSIKNKLKQNQASLEQLFKERETAYKFIFSIPASMLLSFISSSIGFSFLKNLLITYQSGAIMWLVTNHELSHIKISLVDFLFSSSIDKLHKWNDSLLALCTVWLKANEPKQQEIVLEGKLEQQMSQSIQSPKII